MMTIKKLSIKKLFTWLDDNFLTVLAGLLLVAIPLYPKIPLFDAIPGYIVRVRLEDFLILFTFLIWGIQLLRKKISLPPLITKIVLAYLVIGFLSTLSAMFITKTVPLSDIHIFKLYFHYIRRIEYFTLIFIMYSAIKTKKQAKIILSLLIPLMILIAIYGYGQKYFYWPVYSTMNREFAKGWVLYLTEHARVPSTFGGHYDAAAFTMFILAIILGIFLLSKNIYYKIFSGISFVAGLWLLILTASRTSFIGYLAAVTILMGILAFKKSFKWAIPRYLVVMVFSLVLMLSFSDLSERFTQLLGLSRIRDQFKDTFLAAKIARPEGYLTVDEISMVTTPGDTPPTTEKPSKNNQPKGLPVDVYENIPIMVEEKDEKGEGTGVFVPATRNYSDNAYKYGLSVAIRLDALWPRAIAGFMKNPLLGSGYATLTKEEVGQFTEAESTDNDYLRSLGETGALGFVTFFGVIVATMIIAVKMLATQKDPLLLGLVAGYLAGSVGMLINAFYIDVFEASKVVLTYWAITGLILALARIANLKDVPQKV